MKNNLLNFINSIDGTVLLIGIDNNHVLKTIDSNNAITESMVLSNNNGRGSKFKKSSNNRNVNIRKLRKIFKKNSIDYTIININEIEPYIRFVVRDSIYYNNKVIYCYGSIEDYKISGMINKYKRYNVVVESDKIDNISVIRIYTTNKKINWFKNILYKFIDFWSNIGDLIGDSLFG